MKPPHIQQNKCNCDGPYTCKKHDGEFAFCSNPKCTCHSTPTQHTCCDGECNHDSCCGKVPENCPNYYKESNHPDLHPAPTQPEWMKILREEFKKHFWGKFSETGFEAEHVNKMADWWLAKFSTTIQKEKELWLTEFAVQIKEAVDKERESIVEECEKRIKEIKHDDNWQDYIYTNDPVESSKKFILTSIQEFVKNKILKK